jgi:hypothetical protein
VDLLDLRSRSFASPLFPLSKPTKCGRTSSEDVVLLNDVTKVPVTVVALEPEPAAFFVPLQSNLF